MVTVAQLSDENTDRPSFSTSASNPKHHYQTYSTLSSDFRS